MEKEFRYRCCYLTVSKLTISRKSVRNWFIGDTQWLLLQNFNITIAKYLGNSISSSIKIKKCKALGFVSLNKKSKLIQFMKAARLCVLEPWKTKMIKMSKSFSKKSSKSSMLILTLMTLHKLYLRVNSPILATLLNKD
jgi:hypothetical protein